MRSPRVCLGALLVATPPTAVALRPAHFVPAAGWHTRVGKPHACPGVSPSRCVQAFSVASTTHWRDCLECLPHRTVDAMTRDDVAIQIDVSRERTMLKPTTAWPPRIRRHQVVAGFEGLPSRIGTYQGRARLGKREVSLFVIFGRSAPTDRQLARANAELRRARF
jgi:hypothetical protein